jgi:hypothetical protein
MHAERLIEVPYVMDLLSSRKMKRDLASYVRLWRERDRDDDVRRNEGCGLACTGADTRLPPFQKGTHC